MRGLCFCRGVRANKLPKHWRGFGMSGAGPERALAAGQVPKLREARDSLPNIFIWYLFILNCKQAFTGFRGLVCVSLSPSFLSITADSGFLPCLKTCSHKNIKGSKLFKSWEHGWERRQKARSAFFGH